MAELVDANDSKSFGANRAGSSPALGTNLIYTSILKDVSIYKKVPYFKGFFNGLSKDIMSFFRPSIFELSVFLLLFSSL